MLNICSLERLSHCSEATRRKQSKLREPKSCERCIIWFAVGVVGKDSTGGKSRPAARPWVVAATLMANQDASLTCPCSNGIAGKEELGEAMQMSCFVSFSRKRYLSPVPDLMGFACVLSPEWSDEPRGATTACGAAGRSLQGVAWRAPAGMIPAKQLQVVT